MFYLTSLRLIWFYSSSSGGRLRFTGCNHRRHPYSFFLRVMVFLKTVSKTRLCRRFMLVVGASPSLILFRARGSGSAGLGRGEIRSTSATGRGSETVLDLKIKRKTRFWLRCAGGGDALFYTEFLLGCSFARLSGFGNAWGFLHFYVILFRRNFILKEDNMYLK